MADPGAWWLLLGRRLTEQGWPWVFIRGADVIVADTVTDLCGQLIDGYDTIPAAPIATRKP